MATREAFTDKAELAMELEFVAAMLRSPDDLRRYSDLYELRLAELAEADADKPLPGTTPIEVWALGAAMSCGLQIYQHIAPGILTPAVLGRAYELLRGLYPKTEFPASHDDTDEARGGAERAIVCTSPPPPRFSVPRARNRAAHPQAR